MKTTQDIKRDMSALYDMLMAGAIDVKIASEAANIAGKFLKAEQLELAREIFMDRKVFGGAPLTLDAPQKDTHNH